jgi:hypothetical protein
MEGRDSSTMAQTTRRQFVQQTLSAAAALHAFPMHAFVGRGRLVEAQPEIAGRSDGAAIRKLASQIRGHIITPEAPDYETSRLVFNRAFDRHPTLIVRCAGATDVPRALEFAQNQSTE